MRECLFRTKTKKNLLLHVRFVVDITFPIINDFMKFLTKKTAKFQNSSHKTLFLTDLVILQPT